MLRSRLALVMAITSVILQLAPAVSAQQSPPPQQAQQQLEQFITRLREGLGLTETQVAELRKLLARHAPKVMELRQRVQAQPYAPQLQVDIEKEQAAFRDEIGALLNPEQKSKLASLDARLPIPPPPGFYLINIPARTRPDVAAPSERLLPTVQTSAKARGAKLADDYKVLHLLNRITFGPRPGDLEQVKQIGIDRFIDRQLHPETIDDSDVERRLAVLPTLQMTPAELYQFYPPLNVVQQRASQPNAAPVFGRPFQVIGELQQQKLVRAVSSNRQLQEVMVDFWFNHFNVFANKEADQWMITSYERDVIRPNALGKFRDLLLAVAQSPAMLFYLDNWLSASPDARQPRPPARRPQGPPPAQPPSPVVSSDQGRVMIPPGEMNPQQPPGTPKLEMQGPKPPEPPKPPAPPQRKPGINENYARELMELHTMGVDGGYTQKDVQEVARCFTGWTINQPFQGGGFMFRPWAYDSGSKTVLGVTIPAGGGISDGIRVINVLSRQPSTARLIAKKLCQRFVSDSLSSQLVDRIAQVFLRTDGDIREVVRAILASSEFSSVSSFRSKVRSPLELAASAIRAVDGDTNGAPALHDWLRKMGEPLYQYQAPTGYSENSSTWMNTGVFLNRLNFVAAFAGNQIAGTGYDPARLISSAELANLDDATSKLAALIVHTELSRESRSAIRAGLSEPPAKSQPLGAAAREGQPTAAPARFNMRLEAVESRRVARLVGLLLAAAEFQRR